MAARIARASRPINSATRVRQTVVRYQRFYSIARGMSQLLLTLLKGDLGGIMGSLAHYRVDWERSETGHERRWTQAWHPGSLTGTELRHRGQRSMKGFVRRKWHRGHTRASDASCSSSDCTVGRLEWGVFIEKHPQV